jgi:MFS transporter, FHS family, glucose/mannose:H+ symporter
MTKTLTRTIVLLTAAAFFAFFVFGFTDNLKGATLPPLLNELGLSYSIGGTILMGAYVGFIIATLFTGILADTLGNKTVIILAGVLLFVGVLGYSSSTAAGGLVISMGVIGLGLGSIELGANSIIVEIHAAAKGRYLNLMSVFHGLGSMLAPLFAGWLLVSGSSWRTVYRWDLVLAGLMVLVFIVLPYPRFPTPQSQKIDLLHLSRAAFARPMGWFYFAMAVYVAIELGLATWLITYLQDVHQVSTGASAVYLSVFFGLVMLGRFLGSFAVERVGYLRSILYATIGATICIGLGVLGPSSLVVVLPLAGFFLSIIFPTLTAAVSDLHTENMASILGLLFTFAGVGGMIGPWLIGLAGDMLGLSIGFGVTLLYCGVLLVITVILIKETGHDGKGA